MFKEVRAYSGFSVDDPGAARKFYGEVLGLEMEDYGPGVMLKIAGSNGVFFYPKNDHVPATFTILNFPIDDIDRVVDELMDKGVAFELYEGVTDERGIARGLSTGQGPDIAWFRDPAGNILAVLQEP